MGQCQCEIRHRYERMCKKAGFNLKNAPTLDDYKVLDEITGNAKMQAEEYIKNFDTIRKQKQNWFFLCGQSGAGKTMLGRAIVKALIERTKFIGARAVKYYEMMQTLKAKSNDENYKNILDPFVTCELLFIDDLLKEKAVQGVLTEADTKHLFAVLDKRYDAYLPTVISTECTGQRLDELDEAMHGRIIERSFAKIIFEGNERNYRKRK